MFVLLILSSLVYCWTFNVHILHVFQFYFTLQLGDDIFGVIVDFLEFRLYIFYFFIEISLTWADSVSTTQYSS